jgi:hypothetical protein
MKDSKGHGSEKRGTAAHVHGVNRVGQPVLSNKVLAMIRNNPSGISVAPNGKQPTSGYMVGLPGHSTAVSSAVFRNFPDSVAADFARQHADALKQPGAHLGVWENRAEGKTYLDVSQNISRRNEAIKTGAERNQIAVHDVKRRRDIHTGGSGK